jgi:hypothetical protein
MSNQIQELEVKVVRKINVKMAKLPPVFITMDTGVKVSLDIPGSYPVTCDGDEWRFQHEILSCYKLIDGILKRVDGFYLTRDDVISINLIPLEYPYKPKKIFNSQQEADDFAQKVRNLLDEKSLLVINETSVKIYRNVQEPELIEFPLIAKYGDLYVYKVPGQIEDSTVRNHLISVLEIEKYRVLFYEGVTLIHSVSFSGDVKIISTGSTGVYFKVIFEGEGITGSLNPGTYLFVLPKVKSS